MPETAVMDMPFAEAPSKPLAYNEKGRLDEAAWVCVRNRMDRRVRAATTGGTRYEAHLHYTGFTAPEPIRGLGPRAAPGSRRRARGREPSVRQPGSRCGSRRGTAGAPWARSACRR